MDISTMTTEKSTHKVEVIEIKELRRHPNADALSIVQIHEYTCIVKTSDWKTGDLAAWIPPDSEVDTSKQEFSFLRHPRIRTKKIRGLVSYGLLMPAPQNSKIGDDVAVEMGVIHWEPKINDDAFNLTGGDAAKPPRGIYFKYDVDALFGRGKDAFEEGELVAITEKIHGSSARFVFQDGQMHYGSRTEWKKEYSSKPNITLENLVKSYNGNEELAKMAFKKIQNWKPKRNLWWQACDNVPAIRKFCESNPGYTLYGEVYGIVGGFKYGLTSPSFLAFDILKPDGSWMDFPKFMEACYFNGIPHVPVLYYCTPYDFEKTKQLAQGNSLVKGANHIREGVVIRPVKERWDERVGRVQFKVINPDY